MQKMIPITALFLLAIPAVFGGSICPPRSTIYPCSCANVPQSKTRFSTVITCHRLEDSDSLDAIFPQLRSMRIDQFYMYDSFWTAHALGEFGESKKVLPADWITLLKIKEVVIEDTTLSSCFACQWRLNCRNTETTKFIVSNSSSSEKICTLCDTGRGNKYPWTGCMTKLKEFRFNYGKLTTLGVDFFPMAMRELKTLNLSYNQIVKIDPNALKNLPELTTLDLSHNAIEFIDHMFGNQGPHLVHLDVSWNFIKAVGADLFASLPVLKTFKADNNVILEMKESEWKNAPATLIHIDLSNNPIHCDCNTRWVNSTFPVTTDFRGTCSTPEDYQYSPIRRASRFLTERCTSAGVVGTRKPTRKTSRRTPSTVRGA